MLQRSPRPRSLLKAAPVDRTPLITPRPGGGWAASGAGVGRGWYGDHLKGNSSTGTYFGPSRYAQFNYAPTTTGYYEIDLAWISTAGQIGTAVNLYTGVATGGAADRLGNTGGPQGIITSGTMNMYYAGVGAWNQFTTAQLNSGTTYHVGIYGGYKTPYAGGVTPADPSANRVTASAVRFMAATPVGVTYSGLANHATDVALTGTSLSWTAGSYCTRSSTCGLAPRAGSLAEIGTGLSASTLSLNLDSQDLQGGTQYFWRVDAGNVDAPLATGTVFDFTTVAVPEPSTAVLSLLGRAWNAGLDESAPHGLISAFF